MEMTAIHRESVEGVMGKRAGGGELELSARAVEFLGECLSPFEMTLRAFRETNMALYRLNEMLEEEAKRIARALHDEAGQLLAAAHIALDGVAEKVPPSCREDLMKVQHLLDLSEEQLRHLAHELRPSILDDLGLIPALEFLAHRISRRTKLTVVVRDSVEERPSPLIETALYRIVREALTNVVKHSRATRAIVKVRVKEKGRVVRCSIRDNGIGLHKASEFSSGVDRGFGLIGIRERVGVLRGTLEVNSSPGNGTELIVTVPSEVRDVAAYPSR